MTTRVWVLWHGGPSYSPGSVDDDTIELPSVRAAVELCADRFANRDGTTPAVDYGPGDSAAWLWFSDPRGQSDPYPDRVIELGPRGGLRVMPA